MRGWPPPTRPRWLAEANGLDFDDMLLAAVRTLHEHPETRHAAGERFPRILIDEHQDTNLPQYVLVRHCPKTARRLRGRGPQLGHLRLARTEMQHIMNCQRDFPRARRVESLTGSDGWRGRHRIGTYATVDDLTCPIRCPPWATRVTARRNADRSRQGRRARWGRHESSEALAGTCRKVPAAAVVELRPALAAETHHCKTSASSGVSL